MEKKQMFKNFSSVAEAEVLSQQQMDALEAGGSCQSGCKKSCKPGNQNISKTHPYILTLEEASQLR